MLIKINKSTIEKRIISPIKVIPKGIKVSFSADELIKDFECDSRLISCNYVYEGNSHSYFEYVMYIEKPDDLIGYDLRNIIFNYEYEEIRMLLPRSDYWHYSYDHQKIQCNDCDEYFMSNELESDEYFDGDDEYYSDSVCPKCGAFSCVDIDFEKLTYEMKEKFGKVK